MSVSFFEMPNMTGGGNPYEQAAQPDTVLRSELVAIMQDAAEARDGVFDSDIEIARKACTRIFELQENADLLVQEYKAENKADGLLVSFHPFFDGRQAEWSVDGTLLGVGAYDIDKGGFIGEVSSWNGVNFINLNTQLAS